MADPNAIKAALAKLDVGNDDHWTNSGDPRIDVVQELTGDKSIKRPDITGAAPKFSRKTPTELEVSEEPPVVEGGEEEGQAPVVGEPETQEESPIVQEEPPVVEDDMAEAENEIEMAERAVNELQSAVDQAKKALGDAQAYRDELVFKRDKAVPRNAGQLEIMRHLEVQKARRFGKE